MLVKPSIWFAFSLINYNKSSQMNEFQKNLRKVLKSQIDTTDGSHDWFHFERVWKNCCEISNGESANLNQDALFAAAFLHDIVNLPKNHPERSKASLHSAMKAKEILSSMGQPEELINTVFHAIETHSFSAGKSPHSIEAKILQDADRLEALGAIGIARCFYVSGKMNRNLFHPTDPTGLSRPLDDQNYALDHFQVKLFELPKTFQTNTGKLMAEQRIKIVRQFFDHMVLESNISL